MDASGGTALEAPAAKPMDDGADDGITPGAVVEGDADGSGMDATTAKEKGDAMDEGASKDKDDAMEESKRADKGGADDAAGSGEEADDAMEDTSNDAVEDTAAKELDPMEDSGPLEDDAENSMEEGAAKDEGHGMEDGDEGGAEAWDCAAAAASAADMVFRGHSDSFDLLFLDP